MAEDLEEDFDDAEASDDSADSPPKRGGGGQGRKLILFVILPLLLIIGAAAGAYFSGVADPLLNMFKGGGEHKVEKKDHAEVVKAAIFYDLPEMLVNLNSPGRRQNFLKIRVSLELEDALDVGKVEQVMPRIIDHFQVYLRELRVEDLQGAAGMYRLREELLSRVSNAVRPVKVNDVLFKEMLVQ